MGARELYCEAGAGCVCGSGKAVSVGTEGSLRLGAQVVMNNAKKKK